MSCHRGHTHALLLLALTSLFTACGSDDAPPPVQPGRGAGGSGAEAGQASGGGSADEDAGETGGTSSDDAASGSGGASDLDGEVSEPTLPDAGELDAEAPASACTDAATSAPTGLTLAVDTSKPGRSVPRNFLGLSVEYESVMNNLGDGMGAAHPITLQLLKNFTEYDHRVDLRIGGNSSDRSWWTPGPGTRPATATASITPAFLTTLADYHAALGIQFTIGLNLVVRDTKNPLSFMKAAMAGMPADSILFFEIGNEPNWYQSHKVRPAPYGFPEYLKDLDAYLKVLLPIAGKKKFTGPSFGEMKWVPYVPQMWPKYGDAFGQMTLHRYPYSACSTTVPTASNILSEQASSGIAKEYAEARAVALSNGIALRHDEFGPITCGGAEAISRSFTASLWAADVLFELFKADTAGVNFHTPGGNAVFTMDGKPRKLAVHGTYYGMLFFALATAQGGKLLPLSVTSGKAPATLKTYATTGSDGRTRVAVINKDQKAAAKVNVQLPIDCGVASILRLEAPGIDSMTGIKVGGKTFDGSTDGKIQGARQHRDRGLEGGHLLVRHAGPEREPFWCSSRRLTTRSSRKLIRSLGIASSVSSTRRSHGRSLRTAHVALDLPVAQVHHARHALREGRVVRDDHDGRAARPVDLEEELVHRRAGGGSRLPVGSSARRSLGARTSARASATRCCSPPESSPGRWVTRCARPDLLEERLRRARPSPAGSCPGSGPASSRSRAR